MGGGAGLGLPLPRNIHFVSYMEDRAQKEGLKRGAIELFFSLLWVARDLGKFAPPPIFSRKLRAWNIYILTGFHRDK